MFDRRVAAKRMPDMPARANLDSRKSGELARNCGKMTHAVGTAVRGSFARIQLIAPVLGMDLLKSIGRKQILLAD
jgi:hypothetical protein